jgi:hypothetical protein
VGRYNASLEVLKWRYKKYQNNLRDKQEFYNQLQFLREARLDLRRTPAERIVALEQGLGIAWRLRGITRSPQVSTRGRSPICN